MRRVGRDVADSVWTGFLVTVILGFWVVGSFGFSSPIESPTETLKISSPITIIDARHMITSFPVPHAGSGTVESQDPGVSCYYNRETTTARR